MWSNKELSDLSIKLASNYTTVPLNLILTNTKKREVTFTRQIAFWLLKTHTTLSLYTIGTLVGNKDHATVFHGVKTIKDRMDVDSTFKFNMLHLSHEFGRVIESEVYDVNKILEDFRDGIFDITQTAARLIIYLKQSK